MVCGCFVRRKNSIGPLRIQKLYIHLQYNIVNRHDPYSTIVIKSLLQFYAKIIHSYSAIMTPDANYHVVL